MFKKFFPKKKQEPAKPRLSTSIFSTSNDLPSQMTRDEKLEVVRNANFQRPIEDIKFISSEGVAMDTAAVAKLGLDDGATGMDSMQSVKMQFGGFWQNIPDTTLGWFASQGFIGYQLCALLSQNWLIDKACTMPGRDAVRNGYELSLPEEITSTDALKEQIRKLQELDKEFKIVDEMIEFVRNARIFGIRVAVFKVKTNDPLYYEKPFNIDGVTPGSYEGIAQVDPYWMTPELDTNSAANPFAIDFYEPTWWRISGKRIHKSHCIIIRTSEVPDVLKPTYFYGGISVPQKIFERVYAAERTANEAPLLALTKRTTVLKVDLSQAEANKDAFNERMAWWANMRDNLAIKAIDLTDEVEQFDISLADLDAVIMTQYQIVAAIAEVPVTKLLGTTPKGFNATGEFDESSYHEALRSIQTHDLTPFLNRHHEMVIKSELTPKGAEPSFRVEAAWNPLNSPTAVELADINLKKAQTGNALITAGAIAPEDEQQRIINDPDSGYVSVTDIGNIPDPDEDQDENADDA